MTVKRTPARVELCGRLVVEIDGKSCTAAVRGRQGRLLLAYLVLHRQAPVSRDRLTGALWADELPRDPSAVLNTLLSGLRKGLGEGRLEGRRELRIDLGPDAQVDAEIAVAARDAALDALARSRFSDAAATARTAVRLTEQELLAGDTAEWLDRARDEMRAVRADGLEALARASLELGRAELPAAVTAASQLVKLEPFRESGYGLLMEAHAARGNVAEALRVFDEIRTLLRDELGTAPAAPLLELHRRLVALDRTPSPAGEPDAPPPLPPPLARDLGFVGRTAALERLGAAWEETASGERRFVVLAGEPGIGKTTLAGRFARDVHARGGRVLYGRSSEELLVPYEPFVEAVGHYIRTSPPEAVEPAANPELEELARWLPDLGLAVPDAGATAPTEPETRRFRMFEAMVQLLAHVAHDRPLLLVLDDLHWADGSTLRLVHHLVRATRPPRLMVLGTYRDAEVERGGTLDRLLADLRREVALGELPVGGLDETETAALIAARGGSLDPQAAGRLRELTAGNPFFLEETLRSIGSRAGGTLDETLSALGVPRPVADTIERRIARLAPGTGDVLTTASVLGVAFRLGVLEDLVDDDGVDVLAALEAAAAAGLVVELAGPAQWFSFSHELVRATLYDALSRSRALRLHRRAGAALEARRDELGVGPGELAEHFFAARELGEGERAVRYAAQAAEHASASLAYEEAVRHLERALTALDAAAPDDAVRRADLLLALGEAQLRVGTSDARATFARAADAARGASSERLARAAIGFCGRYYEAGVIDQELAELLEEALAALDEDDSTLRAQLLGRLGEVLHFSGEPERGMELTAAAVAMARRLGDPDALTGALAGRHVSLLHVAHLGERFVVSGELCDLARTLDRPELAVFAHHARLYDLFESGDVAAARVEHDELKRRAAELRQPLFRSFAESWASVWAQMEGRFAEAERRASELLELQQRRGDRDAETVFAARVFAIRRDQGRLGELLPVVDGFIERFPDFKPVRAALPLVCVEAGDEERARAELRAVAAMLDTLPRDFFWLSAAAWIAEAAAEVADEPVIRELRRRLEAFADRTVQVGFAACLGSVSRVLGLGAAALGEHDLARRHLEAALARNTALEARALVVRSQAELARALLHAGARGEDAEWAEELAASALTGARELGMAGVAARLT